ncbi:MAG TPA: pitrilysin family protein [Dehalococcoidia bacterium]|nr:pitrilysin family protein [Dehalococcoidia bacterium]
MVSPTQPTLLADVLPFAATETTLANGLRVIVVPTGYPNLVSLQIPVQTGSRNEVEPGRSGFAHFFEHMMFRGTDRFSPSAYQEIVTRTGARQNAYTTDDFTNYHMTFAREDLQTVLEIEADRFMNLAYAEADFKTEARAVLGEYNKSSANPLTKLIEVQHDHAFIIHPYKHTTMGFLADIERMPDQYDYSRSFFERWYRPEYTTLLIAGDVDPDAVLPLVERYWSGWRSGGATVEIPQEPSAYGPVLAHVPWPVPTLPLLTIAFHSAAFSETDGDFAALDLLLDLYFGPTSELYRRLVEEGQVVDQLFASNPETVDPSLATIFARVRRASDVAYVRDAILATVAATRRSAVDQARIEEAKSHARYAFVRTLDNSESVAATLAGFVRFRRAYDTLNALYRIYARLEPDDLLRVARTYLTDAALVQTTLSEEPLPGPVQDLRPIDSMLMDNKAERTADTRPELAVLRSPSTLLRFKLLFTAGSAHDPVGKEGIAALAGEMIAGAGSEQMRIDEIKRALFPMAGSFSAHVDREMTTFTGVIHRDNLDAFAGIVVKQLLAPGLREADFTRLRANQLNELVQDLRTNNEEELGKERLQTNIFAGTPYGHTTLGTVAGIEAIRLEDVRDFIASHYTAPNLLAGMSGDVPETFLERLRDELALLPRGEAQRLSPLQGRFTNGLEVEVIEKDTRATAISFGFPIAVTRAHPDFAALWLARSWLGEHRASQGRLFQRLREVRGLNYGDYAYVEAFPGGMYRMFPDPNAGRHAQIFEVWIRPVAPENAVFALKLAMYELRTLLDKGLSDTDFDATRNYLMKNVYVMTKTQDQQLGYALDSRWYGAGEFTSAMRSQLAALTLSDVNAALRRHLTTENLSVVFVTKDANGLREELLSSSSRTPVYDTPKPELAEEDRLVAASSLAIAPERIRITPVEDVWAR